MEELRARIMKLNDDDLLSMVFALQQEIFEYGAEDFEDKEFLDYIGERFM